MEAFSNQTIQKNEYNMSSKKTVIEEQVNGIWTFKYPPEVELVVVSGDIHGAFRGIVNKVVC